jgi:hypothetical protein
MISDAWISIVFHNDLSMIQPDVKKAIEDEDRI